jgi:hypothetical protein
LDLFAQQHGHLCYCVVPKYVDVVITYAPLTVGSSLCLCSSVVYHSVYADKVVDLNTKITHKTTWRLPDGQYFNQIEHIMIDSTNISNLKDQKLHCIISRTMTEN